MPEEENKKEHSENANAYLYNPNRPNNTNENNDTQKMSDEAAKGLANYAVPGVGGAIYDTAKKVSGVGKAIDKTTKTIATPINQVPGMNYVTQESNNNGLLNAANKENEYLKTLSNSFKSFPTDQNEPNSYVFNPSKNNKNSQKTSRNPYINIHSMPKNTAFQTSKEEDEEDFNKTENLPEESPLTTSNDNSLNTDPYNSINQEETPSSKNRDFFSVPLKKIWQKYKIPLILGGGGIALFLIFFLVLFGGGATNEENNLTGYYDACNYNDTTVRLVNCAEELNEKNTILTDSLENMVLNLTYLYSKNYSYSNEAIKALMIALKTNILSYGNYNSTTKNVEISLCDIYPDFQDTLDTNIFKGIEEQKENLKNLYNEIANYLYLSSSYTDVITSLSNQDSLNLNDSILSMFESLAISGNNYQTILQEIYKNTNTTVRYDLSNTLFLGDSRISDMVSNNILNDNFAIYNKRYGFNWLEGTQNYSSIYTNSTAGGISGINNLIKEGESYNIIIWLGINDLDTNAEEYYRIYYDQAVNEWSKHHLYIVSLGPLKENNTGIYTNENVNKFNNTMKNLITTANLDNLTFIDLNYNIEEYDNNGISYTKTDYEVIYHSIMSSIEETPILSNDYELYNLNAYCTYYTLTENDAFWWPVGSAEPTNGNIYGGEPVSTNITSHFGTRADNHGGMDVGVVRGTPIIATRSGTVLLVYTGCVEGDTSCGETYGNMVKIDHGDGIEAIYAHLNSVEVQEGDIIKQGELIGYSGNTGNSSGPHLHFEIRVNGIKVNPLEYVDPNNPRPITNYSCTTSNIENGTVAANQQAICKILLNSGFSNNAVAGMLTNIAHEGMWLGNNLENCYEDGVRCAIYNDYGICDYGWCVNPIPRGFGASDEAYTRGIDSGSYTKNEFIYDRAGYGLAGWTDEERKKALYEYTVERGLSISSISGQTCFLMEELSDYNITYKYITGNYSAYDTAVAFCKDFEKPAGSVQSLGTSDSCTARASASAASMLKYVENGCSY